MRPSFVRTWTRIIPGSVISKVALWIINVRLDIRNQFRIAILSSFTINLGFVHDNERHVTIIGIDYEIK